MSFIANVYQQATRDRSGDKPVKKVYNKATDTMSKPAPRMDTTEWWRRTIFGGAPASLRNRKQKVDKEVERNS